MTADAIHVIWFKRDLRVYDHRPLAAGVQGGRVLPLYIVEPSLIAAPDFDRLHADFIDASLIELDAELSRRGSPLWIVQGEVVDVLEGLWRQIQFSHLESHEETGTELTYARDRAVKQWVQSRGVIWREYPQYGVFRGPLNRDGWQTRWERFMAEPITPAPSKVIPWKDRNVTGLRPLAEFKHGPFHNESIASQHPAVPSRQPDLDGGRSQGVRWLDSFLDRRGRGYQSRMSSPVTAYESCSRLSPYISWGCLSMREILHSVRKKRAKIKQTPSPAGITLKDLRSVDARLHWHCHFIQKLESEPEIEFSCFNRACENLRRGHDFPDRLEAWMNGRTGYPFVDACMRALQTRGWINFRMRAMLVSFAAYDLWLDWRDFRDFLACQFIDYEPGIHISQIQMQSGTTGINTLRMYNPVKQGHDQDPQGAFIREWVPELQQVSAAELHTPWLCAQKLDYPDPIVDHAEAVRHARAEFAALRRLPEHRAEAQRVAAKHGSRKKSNRSRERKAKPKPSPAQQVLPLSD